MFIIRMRLLIKSIISLPHFPPTISNAFQSKKKELLFRAKLNLTHILIFELNNFTIVCKYFVQFHQQMVCDVQMTGKFHFSDWWNISSISLSRHRRSIKYEKLNSPSFQWKWECNRIKGVNFFFVCVSMVNVNFLNDWCSRDVA